MIFSPLYFIFNTLSKKHGISRLKRGASVNNVIIGMDTETLNGPPITFQFFSKNKNFTKIYFLDNPNNASKIFFDYLNLLPTNGNKYIIYGHNLQFDILSLFWDQKEKFLNEEINFEYKEWLVTGVYSNLVFIILRNKKSKKVVWILDTFAFFPSSLFKLSEIFCNNLPKLIPPKNLGKRRFTEKNKNFVAYAMRDAEIAYHAGVGIDFLHDEMGIPQSVSRANMSGKIFMHKYIDENYPVIIPDLDIISAACWAYHGGKNGLYCKKNTLYKDIYGIDIISAYPYAMSKLPSFTQKSLYKRITVNGHVNELPKFGVYKINGFLKTHKYPIFYSHNFKPIFGKIENVWVSSFEVNTALKYKLLTIDNLEGYIYESEKDNVPSPWRQFAIDFFEKKTNAEKQNNKLYREFFKVILNSLYGKTIEMTKKDSYYEEGFDLIKKEYIENQFLKGGRLFNSFIACMITGFIRSYIYELENQYKSLHTSTDGFFSKISPKEHLNLGGIKQDFFGDVWIGRNKLYIGYVNDIKKACKDKDGKPIKSDIYKDKFIGKYALHGFHSDVKQLEWCIKNNKWEYSFEKCNKLKESFRSKLIPNKFEYRDATLNI